MKNPNLLRTSLFVGSFLLQLSAFSPRVGGAAGDVDLSFDPGLGVNGSVSAAVVQSDGKVIIGGQFTTVRGFARTNLARLNPDGSGDVTFNPPMAFDLVDSLALQPDGKLLVGSQFVSLYCDEFDCYYSYESILNRLDSNGSLDPSFLPARVDASSPYGFSTLAVQADGRVLVGGYFSTLNGVSRRGIGRLNADGTLDTSFDPGLGIGDYQPWVFAIALQSDGKVLVGGTFTTFDGTNRNGIARLNANGRLDTGFNAGTELHFSETYPYPRVESILVQPEGKFLVAGYFTNALGNSILRFNANGSVDGTFNSGLGANGVVGNVAQQPDGKVLISGYFTQVNGTSRNRIARLNANGTLDTSFDPGTGISAGVETMVLQSNGKLIVGGGFTLVNDVTRNRVARLNADGSLDGAFDPGSGLERVVSTLALQDDGKVLMGGPLVIGSAYFAPAGDVLTFVSGADQYGRLRLNRDGTSDDTFVSSINFKPDLSAFINPGDCAGPPYGCYQGQVTSALLVQADGEVLLGGYTETTITGDEVFVQSYRYFLGRFHPDGSPDIRFHPATEFYPAGLAQQQDGKIIVVGNLRLNGTNCAIARLSSDGNPDPSFQIIPAPFSPSCVAVQADGKILVGGSSALARLNSDGSRDACFNPSVNGNLSSLIVQPDGKVLLGGSFSAVNGVGRNGIARINIDGSLDGGFDPGMGVQGLVSAMVLQPDGNVIIGGDFYSVNGVVRPYVARLYGNPSGPRLRVFGSGSNSLTVAWPGSSSGFTLQQTTNLTAPDWITVAPPPSTVGSENEVTVEPLAGQLFLRLSGPGPTSPPNPVPPPVPPTLSASAGNAQVILAWNALAGAIGHRVQRSTSSYEGPYTTIAQPRTNSYTDLTALNDITYYYRVSVTYPCGESAYSLPFGIVAHAPPPTVHVQSIAMSWVAAGSRYKARALVNVVNDRGVAVSGANVVGDFSGAINNAGLAGVTGSNGNATLTTTSAIRTGTVAFTVTGVTTSTMGYNPAANSVTSGTISR